MSSQTEADVMEVVEQGRGAEAVICVHGFISSNRWWKPFTDLLAPETYHSYAVNLPPGDATSPEAFTLAQYTDNLAVFVENRQLRNITLIGHSVGAAVATLYALSHPDIIRSLVLVSPLTPAGVFIPEQAIGWMLSQQGKPEGIQQMMYGVFAQLPPSPLINQIIADGAGWSKAAFETGLHEMTAYNVADRLGQIKARTLIVGGDKDQQLPLTGHLATWSSIPNAGLEIWHGVGHSPHVEMPERFAQLVKDFIRG